MRDIGVRLKEFRLRSKSKMPAVAAAIGIAKETLYKWEKGTKPSDINDYFKLKAYLDKMEYNEEEAIFEHEGQKPATIRLPFDIHRPAVPNTDGRSASGTVLFTNNQPELIVDRMYAPFVGMVEGVIEVTGDGMYPTFCNGCKVAISRLKDCRILDWGLYYYIIDINWKGLVRRVYQGGNENTLRLISDNPDQLKYPPIEKSLDQIEAIFKIDASINKH